MLYMLIIEVIYRGRVVAYVLTLLIVSRFGSNFFKAIAGGDVVYDNKCLGKYLYEVIGEYKKIA